MLYTSKGTFNHNPQDNIQQYFPLVKKIANHINSKINFILDIDDLIQAGMLGLLDALKKYQVQEKSTFEHYASIRIQGSILDEIRHNDHLSQDDRKLTSQINQLKEKNKSLGISTSNSEICKTLNISSNKLFELENLMFSFVNLESVSQELENIPNSEIESLDSKLFDKEKRLILVQEIKKLSEREQILMSLYYEENLTLKEISEVLEITEARVSQLHNQIIRTIKNNLKI
jgi:RNA polymerase sigma factor for flagellar operon FliA